MASEIKNIFVLLLENRSFDHMLGFSGITGIDAETGKETQIKGLDGSEWNGYLGAPYYVGKPFHEPIPVDPAHEFLDVLEQLCGTQALYESGKPYPHVNNSGFVSDYARSHTKGEGNATGNFGQIMDGFTADQLPVLNTLARNFAVCDGWHSSLPGPTFPNRLFAMGASSAGLDHSPSTGELLTWEGLDGFTFPRGSIFDALNNRYKNDAWRIYAGSSFPLVSALKGINTFDVHSVNDFGNDLKNGSYPYCLTWIEPDYGDMVFGTFRGGTSQHPMDNVSGGEKLIKEVYEAIRNSPLWESSLLIVTWDEHGGFYDHVPPGEAVAPGDTGPRSKYNQYGFTFTQFGIRVPAVVISPLIPAGTIDHRLYDHSSIPKSVGEVFNLEPLTNRDKAASSVMRLLTLSSARKDTPVTLPPQLPLRESSATPRPGVDSVDSGNLPLFLHIAMRHELALSHPGNRNAVLRRAQSVRTRTQAAQYLAEIADRVNAVKSQVSTK
jgi:phospholipase C